MSTRSNNSVDGLIDQSYSSNTFEDFRKSAEKDRNRLSSMLDEFKRDSLDEDVEEDAGADSFDDEDDDDADHFIVNKRDSGYLPQQSSTQRYSTDDAAHLAHQVNQLEITEKQQESNIHPESNAIPKLITPQTGSSELFNKVQNDFEFEPPKTVGSQSSADSYHTALNDGSSLSIDKRRSIISDYTPSLHEANQVTVIDHETKPESNLKPSVVKVSRNASRASKASLKGANKQAYQQDDDTEQDFDEADTTAGASVKTINTHEKNKESLMSTATYTSTGSSKFTSSTISGKDTQFNPSATDVHQQTVPEITGSTESFSFDVGPLQTKKEEGLPQFADRLSTTDFDAAIPSRSPRRPVSAFPSNPSSDSGEKEPNFTRRTKSDEYKNIDSLVSDLDAEISKSPFHGYSKSTNQIDDLIIEPPALQVQPPSNYSTPSQYPRSQLESEVPRETSNNQYHERSESSQSIESTGVSQKNPRPLPPPPLPKHDSGVPSQRSLNNNQEIIPGDDGFITEDEDKEDGTNQSAHKHTHSHESSHGQSSRKHKKKSSKDKRKSLRKSGHFNHDTLVQLLQVTEGTIIGEEFQNIGLEASDKQLLERLVDSLSRLTADMIIDSDRHEESVKRLNKAIKALEGF